MNAIIEPDSVNIKNYIGNIFKEEKILKKPISDKNELKKFINETISQSNFSTRYRDAHKNILSKYYDIRENDSTLINKYLNGSAPNELLYEKDYYESINNEQKGEKNNENGMKENNIY